MITAKKQWGQQFDTVQYTFKISILSLCGFSFSGPLPAVLYEQWYLNKWHHSETLNIVLSQYVFFP